MTFSPPTPDPKASAARTLLLKLRAAEMVVDLSFRSPPLLPMLYWQRTPPRQTRPPWQRTQQLERQFYDEFFANHTVSVRITAPRRITDVSDGEASGARASRHYSLAELAAADADVLWRVDW